jgi:type IV pilus biogenesis protein CpaD/CtpE
MRRRIVGFVLIAAAAALLAGCVDKDVNVMQTPVPPPPPPNHALPQK